MSQDAALQLAERFGLDGRSLALALDLALERRVDYADLFFEYSVQDSMSLEDGIVKSGDRHLSQGVGVRAQAGERQGYAHSDEISVDSLRLAATTARAICESRGAARSAAIRPGGAPARDLYPVRMAPTEVPVERKTALLESLPHTGGLESVRSRTFATQAEEALLKGLTRLRGRR